MGYPALDIALVFGQSSLPYAGSHVAISDTLRSDGSWLLHHFIVNQLKAARPVILVGVSQILNHYVLGVNLATAKQNGQLIFIDALTHLDAYSRDFPHGSIRSVNTPNSVYSYADAVDKDRPEVRGLFDLIRQHVQTTVDAYGKPPLVVIDDVSSLVWTGAAARDVVDLVQTLKSLVALHGGSLITLTHADQVLSEDQTEHAFANSIMSSAEVILDVHGLESGTSRDVHGELNLLRGPQSSLFCSDLGIEPITTQSLHYKVLDNTVQLFPKGISLGVI